MTEEIGTELTVTEAMPLVKVAQVMSISDIQATAKAIVASKMFAGVTNESEALVKILAGQELGLGPVASINGLYSLNGKIGMMASVAGALLQKYGYRWDIVWDDVDNPTACEITYFHSSLPPNGWTNRFTVADAIRAKLIKQDGAHQKYPKDMLFNRAFMAGARKVAPSVLLNMGYEYDELKEAAPLSIGTPPLPIGYNDSSPKPKPASAPSSIATIPIVTMDTIDCPLHPGIEARLNKWGSAYSHPTAGKTPEGKTIWCNTKIDKKPDPMPNQSNNANKMPPAQPQGEITPSAIPFKDQLKAAMKAAKYTNADLLDHCKRHFGLSDLTEVPLLTKEDKAKLLKDMNELIDLANA